MKVLFVAAELAPIVKVGGLGDVIEALPKALEKEGVEVSIVIPRYTFIEKDKLKLVAKDIPVPLARGVEKVSLYKGLAPRSPIPVFFVDNPTYLSTGPAPYFDQTAFVGAREEIERFVFFSKAVEVLLKLEYLKADIVHAHDWHTGALVSLISNGKSQILKNKLPVTNYRLPKTIFTIHNLGNQGKWRAVDVDALLGKTVDAELFTHFDDAYNFIAEGILHADWITTVSKTYAKEILTKQYGNGMENVLTKRKKRLTGILNGIDYEFFNPETDQKIFENFSPKNVEFKRKNKETLGQALRVPMGDAPLFAMVSRLTEQKGIDLVIKALTMFAGKHDARFVFLGTGAKEYEDALLEFQDEYPDRVAVRITFDETLAHRMYAASDFFLMPSRFEPCGLGQMIAMRYGSLPIVRATGGLKDSVRDMKTGFVFEKAIDLSLDKAMRQAFHIYKESPKKFSNMRQAAMTENFDFKKSAIEYKELYQKVLREK